MARPRSGESVAPAACRRLRLMHDLTDHQAAAAPGYVPRDLLPGAIAEDGHAQGSQDRDPSFVDIRLGWKDEREEPLFPRVEIDHEHARVEGYDVGGQAS